MKVKVSVIVPVYNMERLLPRCVDSLLGQTLRELKVILVDDGSRDKSPRICDEYARRDDRVMVVHQTNKGQGQARNTGLACAEGEYVGFADADDYVLPQMYERLYQAAVKERADMALAGMRQVGGNLFKEQGAERKVSCFERTEIFRGGEGRKKLMLGTTGALPREPEDSRYNFAVWKNLYRRSIIRDNEIRFRSEREVLSEDLFFGLDFISHVDRAVGIPGAFYCYCRNTDSTSRRYQEDLFLRAKAMEAEICGKLSAFMPEAQFMPYTDRMLQAWARVAAVQEILFAKEGRAGRRKLIRRLDGICGDGRLQQVLRRYPYLKLPAKQAVFAFAMRYRLSGLLCLLVWLRERGQGD